MNRSLPGALAFNYRDSEDMLRANWTRDAA